jgi:RNA polymerase sigma factor (sigma-70 family)
MTDLELLRQYRQSHSQEAFAELARRHADWVYSAALRMVRDHHIAEEVAQAAFLVLARKAARVRNESLTPWLFGVVRNCSSHALRSRRRRSQHEREAAMMAEMKRPEPAADWSQIAPLLDESVAKLKAADRQVVLMRYYQRRSVADVAAALKITEAAARKRLTRAVDKLRERLGAKGIVIPVVALGALLTTETTHAAPAGLLTGSATAGSGAIAKGVMLTMLTTKTKIAAMFVMLALLVPTGIGAYLWAADGSPPDNPPSALPNQPAVVVNVATKSAEVKVGADLTAEELANVLGIQTWKFDVTVPPGATEIRGELESRHKSGKPKSLIGFWYDVKGENPHRLIASLAPAGDKVRINLTGFGGGCSDVIDDPFRFGTSGGTTTTWNEPPLFPDGSFALMGYFSRANPVTLDANGNPQTNPPNVNTDEATGADIALDLRLTPIFKPAPAK